MRASSPRSRTRWSANPVVYAPERFVAGFDLPHPATPVNQSVFIGDIHGRLWRFDSNDSGTRQLFRNLGPDQPMGVGASLLNLGGNAHVFVETGSDARVPAPARGIPHVRLQGCRAALPGGRARSRRCPAPEFGLSFPPATAGQGRLPRHGAAAHRVRPETTEGVVFFAGTRFNPVAAGRCVSSFDTIIFGLIADTGGTAYATTEYDGRQGHRAGAAAAAAEPRVPAAVRSGDGAAGPGARRAPHAFAVRPAPRPS